MYCPKNSPTAIFVAYHKDAPWFESNMFHPLHVGPSDHSLPFGQYRDDSGDTISSKNHLYCELTGMYWVWKNFLPSHPEIARIGFCHYRRFLNPFSPPRDPFPFRKTTFDSFKTMFDSWDEVAFNERIKPFDVVLPRRLDLRLAYDKKHETVYSQLVRGTPKAAVDAVLTLLCNRSRTECDAVRKVFLGHCLHNGLTFIMRRNLFEDFSKWLFNVLFAIEQSSELAVRSTFLSSRTPGFIAERLFDVWLLLHTDINAWESDSVLLDNTSFSPISKLRLIIRRYRHPLTSANLIPLPNVLLPLRDLT